MAFNETLCLSNGVVIPKLGLGTWFIEDGKAGEAVCAAVQAGYRHFDTAQAYFNERGVGEGVRGCGIDRESLFVTSKVEAALKTYREAADSIDASLSRMGLDYLDLMLIHSPQPWEKWREKERYFDENREVWRAMEEALRAGKLRSIGVSNFLIDDLESLLSGCSIRPMVNQILTHIGNTPLALIRYCQEKGIVVEAYSPVAHGQILGNPQIVSLAQKYGVSVSQLCIRYCIELGLVALPKAANPAHMAENAALDFIISREDMELLWGLRLMKDYGQFSHFPVFSLKDPEAAV